MTTTRRDIYAGAFFAVGAAAFYTYAAGFPVREGQAAAVSAGFYPQLLAAFLGVLALIQIGQAVLAETKARRSAAGNADEMPAVWKSRSTALLFVLTVVALLAYPFFLRLFGFAITGLLFLGTLIVALSATHRRGRDLWFIAGITVGIAILTYLVFRAFLEIPFPSGVIFR